MSWQGDLLAAIGAPETQSNLNALEWWAESEGMPAWENNWLATTIGGFGGVDVNGVGVKAYPSETAGVQALQATLEGGGYDAVLAAFRTNAPYGTIWTAINRSGWCSGCQSGLYPVVLYQHTGEGGGGPVSPNPTPQAAPAGGDAHNAYHFFLDYMNTQVPNYVTGLGWIEAAINIANS